MMVVFRYRGKRGNPGRLKCQNRGDMRLAAYWPRNWESAAPTAMVLDDFDAHRRTPDTRAPYSPLGPRTGGSSVLPSLLKLSRHAPREPVRANLEFGRAFLQTIPYLAATRRTSPGDTVS